jgi:hypothetical protein
MNECGKCKFYKPETESCGTLLKLQNLINGTRGGLVEPEDVDVDPEVQDLNLVKFYKKKVRLCGCDMPEKVKWSFESCPIGRWGKYRLTDAETKMLDEFVSSLPTTGKLSNQQVEDIIKWFERVSGRPMKRCDQCVRAVIKELRLQLGKKQDVQI